MSVLNDTLELPSAHPLSSRSPSPTLSPTLSTIDALLRDRGAILRRIRDGEDLAGLARAMILTVAASAAAFGAAMGAFRGGQQVAYAAIKLPLVVLLTAAVCAPALTAINSALDRRADARRDLARVLVALALGSLVLSAQAPLVLLAVTLGVSYHAITLLVVVCCVMGGLAGVALLVAGLHEERPRAAWVSVTLLALFALVGSQMSWTLRPWVLRPRTEGVPFVRALEGSLLESILTAADSARGVYRSDAGTDFSEPRTGEERDAR